MEEERTVWIPVMLAIPVPPEGDPEGMVEGAIEFLQQGTLNLDGVALETRLIAPSLVEEEEVADG